MGDPAGIGGELTLRAWLAGRTASAAFVVLDDPDRMAGLAAGMGLAVPVRAVGSPAEAAAIFADALPVLPVQLAAASVPGRPDPVNAPAVIGAIERAVELARSGAVGGIVTNPISKAVLYEAGFRYPGHTEFLAALTGVPGQEVMMLACPALRVVPVTIHVSLRQAIASLTVKAIVTAARTTAVALARDFGVTAPRLAVAGLNPHAGEGGAMGEEEATIIEPAIRTLRGLGIDATGPWVPDALFTEEARARYDAAICMYHDQGLIPLKALDRANGVNVTLGLPIIRTSPDHGTAFDIAGQGTASPASLIAALTLASELAARRAAGDPR